MPRYTDLALGAGAVLVVGLGILALQPDTLPAPEEGVDAPRSAEPSPLRSRATTTATPTASATSAATTSAPASAAASWVVGAGGDLVVVAPQRDCTGAVPAELMVVQHDGTSSTYAVKGLAAVGGIKVESDSAAVLVGVDGDCKSVGFRTTDAGASWKPLDRLPAIWSLVPGADREVLAPTGKVDVPCAPLSVTGLDDRVARLACTDGRLLGTVSGGDAWSILGNNRNVEAAGFVSATTALALVEDPACKGIQVERSTNGGSGFEAVTCVEGAGPWGLFTDADTAVVVGSSIVARSADDGAKWTVQRRRS